MFVNVARKGGTDVYGKALSIWTRRPKGPSGLTGLVVRGSVALLKNTDINASRQTRFTDVKERPQNT